MEFDESNDNSNIEKISVTSIVDKFEPQFKALRKKETKEFVEIQEFAGLIVVFTSELPNPQPMTATMDLIKILYDKKLWADVNFNIDDLELVEFEMFEADTVGADIRNKLSPPKNLVNLLEIYFAPRVAHASEERQKLYEIIIKEMQQTKISVDYIANLL
jgi:hypothetical protein